MILITGASGMTGGAVLSAALAAGLAPRAMYRTAEDAARAPGGATALVADYADPASLAAALQGIEIAFVVCGPVPQLVALETAMFRACAEAGVRQIVLSSALGAGAYEKSFPRWHTEAEHALHATGLEWTILRPNGFMQNLVTYSAATIRDSDRFYGTQGDAAVSLIDVRDVGEAAARILADPHPHRGRIYELNGPEALTNTELAARLSRATGRTIAYIDLPEQTQREAMAQAGMPDWQIEAILDLQALYRSGSCAQIDGTTASLTGHAPRTIDAYFAETAAAFSANGSHP